MNVVCSHCRTAYRLSQERIRSTFAKVRCSRCHYVFTVYAKQPHSKKAAGNGDRGVAASLSAAVGSNGGSDHTSLREKILAVSNQKGGVAKTSTCLNLGMALALLNKKVLLIDFDPQSNLTLSLGYKHAPSFYDVLHCAPEQAETVIQKTRYPGLWLLPSNENLVLMDKKYFGTVNFERILRDWLERIKDEFDHIIVDTPPSVGFFTLNALTAANLAVIPSLCEYLSANGANQILKVIGLIKTKTNPDLEYRVLITMHDDKDPSAQVVYTRLKKNFRERSFKTVIPFDTKMKESQIMKLPAIIYDKTCRSGNEYMQLARELLNGSAPMAQPSAKGHHHSPLEAVV
jgi:chromosome partitioning protein